MKANYYLSPDMVAEVMLELNPSVFKDQDDVIKTVDDLENGMTEETFVVGTGGFHIIPEFDNYEFSDYVVDLRMVHDYMIRKGLI